ncbi:MAG: sigma-70 family RNA polymerase sigma factor [Thermoanaerobaculia bacterium]
MDKASPEITELLIAWSQGEEQAIDRLAPLVHDRLRRLAASFMNRERPDHTLQTQALVNEAYLRLIDQNQVSWRDRAHFFAIAGRMMRRILVDHARGLGYAKRGGEAQRIAAEELEDMPADRPPELVALDEALDTLAGKDPQLARLVELRYFGGLNREEIAEVLGISGATVTRRWRMARAWLYRYLVQDQHDEL